jgi:hypothetical protein
MSTPVPNANYAPIGYKRVSPGHYRRRDDDPEAQAADRAIEALKLTQHVVAYNGFEPESEVMPTAVSNASPHDTRPPSAMAANPLDNIATLVRLLTYGEMMDLAAAVWKAKPDGKELDGETLPGTLHRWSAKNETP